MPFVRDESNKSLAMFEEVHAALDELLASAGASEIMRLYAEHLRLLLAYEIAALKTSGRKAAVS